MSGTLPKFSRYRVKRGDSLWKISERAYGRGDLWEGISEANHLRRGKPILAGQELIIPTARRPMHRELHGVPPCTPTTPQPLSTHTTAKAPPIPLQKVKGAEAATKTGPYQLARTVRYPPFKYELDGIVAEYHTPVVDYELSYTGEVTLQKEGQILEGLTFTKEGIEVEYKKEASGAFDALFTKSTMKAGNGKAEVSLALGSTLKSGGRVLATSEFSVVSPTEVKYSFKGQEIKGTFRGFEFAGVMGYELDVKVKPPQPPENHAVQVSTWMVVGGVGLVIVAGAIVVGDIVKDGATLGGGLVESPLSFAAAAALFGAGMAKIHGTQPKRATGA